jgi:ATPase subunit of ABC transporter with duplicated ATPase domains
MPNEFLQFSDVTFYYDAVGSPIFDRLSFECHDGWTGVIGANGSGKTTLLRLACRELTPQSGCVRSSSGVIYCPQRTDDPPHELNNFLDANDAEAATLRRQLLTQADWAGRWSSLSHGERKRAQIAVALWGRPAVFALDEPTNHIDVEARRLLATALHSFKGVGLLVSHDRELLDALCRRCLSLHPPHVVMRPGGYTEGAALQEAERQRAMLLHAQARRELQRLRREAVERRQEAARADRKRSKRNLAPGDSDGREKIDRARVTGKDGKAGRLLSQLDGRLRQAEQSLKSIHIERERSLGIHMRGEPIGRRMLFQLPEGALELGPDRTLSYPRLEMERDSRVAIMGPNGSGKTTLVRHILANLELPGDRTVYLPQEVPALRGVEVIAETRRLPAGQLGDVMSYVSRLGSDPERLLETQQPSPGEVRKLMLALGVSRKPHLIVMDEPTNHLDLPSIECLEEALDACLCGLLLVSHDLYFLRRLCRTRWEIKPAGEQKGSRELLLRVSGTLRSRAEG